MKNTQYLWQQYNLHKQATHRHFTQGLKAESLNNYHLAYLCYNKALDARLHADSLWCQLKGPQEIDEGHSQFTYQIVVQYRDRVKALINF